MRIKTRDKIKSWRQNKLTSLMVCLVLDIGFASLAIGQQPAGTVLWKYLGAGTIGLSPALGPDGTVYAISSSLCAITNSAGLASNKWTFAASSQPAVGADGAVYVVKGGLDCLDPDGTLRWLNPAPGAAGAPAIGADNTLYVFGNGKIYAISPAGVSLWSCLVDANASDWFALMSPVVGPDGSIYVGVGNTLYAVNSTGTNKWAVVVGLCQESLSLGADAAIYGSYSTGIFAINADGTTRWLDPFPYFAGGSPVLGGDGTVYASGSTSAGHPLYAISAAGQVRWNILGSPMYGAFTSAALDASGNVYYSVSNTLWAIDVQGNVHWSFTSPNSPPPNGDLANSSPIIGSERNGA